MCFAAPSVVTSKTPSTAALALVKFCQYMESAQCKHKVNIRQNNEGQGVSNCTITEKKDMMLQSNHQRTAQKVPGTQEKDPYAVIHESVHRHPF